MRIKLARRFMALFFTFCMALSFVPIPTFATEPLKINEVNIDGVSNQLWSFRKAPFATVDESSDYTIKSQSWYSEKEGEITPTSEYPKPTHGENYTFNITLEVKEGRVFPAKSGAVYDGVFKLDGEEYNDAEVKVASDGKIIEASLFKNTPTKGVGDDTSVIAKTVGVKEDYTTTHEVEDDIILVKNSDYIIDFTKEDNLSMALRSMANLETTKYYKFKNSDNNSLVETENISEALIKIVGNKSENKAIMTLVGDVDKNTSYALNYWIAEYSHSKLEYPGDPYRGETGKEIVDEIRTDYYTIYKFNCMLKLIVDDSIELAEINNATVSFKPGDKPVFTGNVPDGAGYSYQCEWWETDDGKSGVNSEEFWDRNYENHITSFEGGKTYKYGLYLKADEGYRFNSDTKLKINGILYDYKRSENDHELSNTDDMSTMWVYTDLEMTPQDSVDYKVIEGANSSWVKNSDETLTFRIDGDFSKFVGLVIDDEWVDEENYVAVSGSTVITLKNEYLQTLAIGEHEIAFAYTDGEAGTNFEIKEAEKIYENTDNIETEDSEKNSNISKSNTPKTGDNISNLLLTYIFIAVASGILTAAFYSKKKYKI